MADTEAPVEEKKKGKKGIIIPLVVLLIGIGVGGYFFMAGSKKGDAAEAGTTTTTVHIEGKTVRLQPVTLNLSDGHVLKVGLALQFVHEPENEHLAELVNPSGGGHGGGAASTDVGESPLSGVESKALDQLIETLGDMTYDELIKPGGKAHAKEELFEHIKHDYHNDVEDIYFTSFVMS